MTCSVYVPLVVTADGSSITVSSIQCPSLSSKRTAIHGSSTSSRSSSSRPSLHLRVHRRCDWRCWLLARHILHSTSLPTTILTRSLEARKAAGSPEALRKRRLALRYRTDSVTLLREARHSPIELTSDAFLAATAIMLSNDMLAANSTWREIARLSGYSINARGGCEQMIKGMTVKNSGQLAVLCVLSQLLVLDLYGTCTSENLKIGPDQY